VQSPPRLNQLRELILRGRIPQALTPKAFGVGARAAVWPSGRIFHEKSGLAADAEKGIHHRGAGQQAATTVAYASRVYSVFHVNACVQRKEYTRDAYAVPLW